MRKLTTNGSKLLVLGAVLSCASVLLAVVLANVFPDQTWTALNTAKTLYADTVSRMTPIPTGATRRVEEDRIRESFFRYLIGSRKTSSPIYLSIDGRNPSDDFMARFVDLKPPLRGVSEGESTIKGWIDRSTGERGVVLSVNSVKWSFGDRVEVDGSGGVYEVVRNRGRWNVESVIVHRYH